MPYLKLETNTTMGHDQRIALAKDLSKLVSEVLNKPEKFIMISIQPGYDMVFNQSDAPLVFIELKSIGLPPRRDVSAKVCQFIEDTLNIPKDRVYIEFADSPADMFGWNGGTFEKD